MYADKATELEQIEIRRGFWIAASGVTLLAMTD